MSQRRLARWSGPTLPGFWRFKLAPLLISVTLAIIFGLHGARYLICFGVLLGGQAVFLILEIVLKSRRHRIGWQVRVDENGRKRWVAPAAKR
jgi:hypothetical protein